MIGASGAIAGLLAAYWKLFPYGKVLSVIPLFFVFVREVPAVYYIALWFVLQLLAGFAGLMGRTRERSRSLRRSALRDGCDADRAIHAGAQRHKRFSQTRLLLIDPRAIPVLRGADRGSKPLSA